MKTDLPVSRPSAIGTTLPGILSQPSTLASGDAASSDAATAGRDTSAISLKVERHSRWAVLSHTQAQLSHIQGSEQAVVDSYRELVQLARQLDRNDVDAGALSQRVAQLKQTVSQEGHLDGNLQLKGDNDQARFLVDRVDLLSPKDQDEKLDIRLPDGRNLNLHLHAGIGENQQLQQVGRALAAFNLKADRNDQGQLRLSGNQALLSSPWLFRGQGVRVPAGNPVSIQLGREPDQLSLLQSGLNKGETGSEKPRLRDLLSTLEQQRRVLSDQRQQLLEQVAPIGQSAPSNADRQVQVSDILRKTLQTGDFTLQLDALTSQANVSRSQVVSLLGR